MTNMIFSRAKSFRGLWGNIRFLILYKTWATLVVFALGVLLGLIPGLVFAESLEERIKRHEGVRHCVYYDVFHNPTIGVGHLLKKPVERNTCWTSEQVERVLEHDIYRARHNAAADYGPGFYSLPEPVSDLLTELSFQLGGSGLSTLRRLWDYCVKANTGLRQQTCWRHAWPSNCPCGPKNKPKCWNG